MQLLFRRLRRGSSGRSAAGNRPTAGRVLLVDPDLAAIGHHRRYSWALKQAFEALGFDVQVYSARTCPSSFAKSIGARRIFKSSLYAEIGNGPPLPIRWIRGNAALTRDLSDGLSDVAPGDLILVHTAARDHLLGYYAWYVGLPKPRPRICLQIMFPPEFGAAPADRDLAIELTGRALRPWLDLGSETPLLAVDNRRLGEHLRQLYGRSLPVLPMPSWAGPPPARKRVRTNEPVLFVPGELRREKGKQIVKSAIPELMGGNFSVLLQARKSYRWHKTAGSRLKVTPLQDYQAYLQLLMDADAVLLPYDPSEYAYRSSNLFVEALGCGKPVLVTAGTAMADELERVGPLGVVMKDYTERSFIEGVRELVANLDQLRGAAERIAPEIRARHTAPAFARQVLDWWRGDRAAEPTPPEVARAR
jgi:glycosyltransferase involved in cell wall biosynthesis